MRSSGKGAARASFSRGFPPHQFGLFRDIIARRDLAEEADQGLSLFVCQRRQRQCIRPRPLLNCFGDYDALLGCVVRILLPGKPGGATQQKSNEYSEMTRSLGLY
jgi:hypothetical protein